MQSRIPRGQRRAQAARRSADDGGRDDDLIPDRDIADRFKVHLCTIARWDADPQLGFPAAVVINNRRYRYRSELVRWERSRVVARSNKQS